MNSKDKNEENQQDPVMFTVFGEDTADEGHSGLLGNKKGRKTESSEIPVETLRKNLRQFLESLDDVIPVSTVQGGYSLQEFEVAVGVDGKGTVGFLGTGVEVGAMASLTLKFRRPNST